MVILITGSSGFLGRNLIEKINSIGLENIIILEFRSSNTEEQLEKFIKECNFIYHFAAIHRPKDEYDYFSINVGLTEKIIRYKERFNNNCPILLTSSIQASEDSLYGKSKQECENIVMEHSLKTGAKSIIYRLSNTFGKWATPHHHSVVATFCYNTIRNLPVFISNPQHIMHFHYIEDVIKNFTEHLFNEMESESDGFYRVEKQYEISLKELYEILMIFKSKEFSKINMDNELNIHLYETYKSYFNEYFMENNND